MVELTPGVLALIVVAIILGIFLMLYLYRRFHEYNAQRRKMNSWPPVYNACPDYWADLGNGECQNIHNLGRCPQKDGMLEPNGRMNFRRVGTNETVDGRRRLCMRAKECGLTWENIDTLC
jgi:hypothetical protein